MPSNPMVDPHWREQARRRLIAIDLLASLAKGRQFDLPYLVEQWDDTDAHVDELIANQSITGAMQVHFRRRAPYRTLSPRDP